MNARRVAEVFRHHFALQWRLPLTWVALILLALLAWGLAAGNVTIQTGDSDTAGKKAWMNSAFALARILAAIGSLLFTFFVAVAAGMVVIQDDEEKVGELLHATSLTTREYAWGKWLAAMATWLAVLASELAFHALATAFLTGGDQAEYIGSFELSNHVFPALLLVVPQLVLVGGGSFLLGTWSRKPIPVFFLPAALLLFCYFFLWQWNPSQLMANWPQVEKLLQWADPSGLRWLSNEWIEVDRGVDFYNTQPLVPDLPFLASRVALVLIGLLAVHVAERRFARSPRGERLTTANAKSVTNATLPSAAGPRIAVADGASPHRARLATTVRPPGFWSGMAAVARIELREQKSQPGLYLFVPLILLQTVAVEWFRVGAFDTPLLATAGSLAASTFGTLTVLVCLLLIFCTVESLERGKGRGLAPILYATPIGSAALLFGKATANALVGGVILLAALLASFVVILLQCGGAPLALRPCAGLGAPAAADFLHLERLRRRDARPLPQPLRDLRGGALGAVAARVRRHARLDQLGQQLEPLGRGAVERCRAARARHEGAGAESPALAVAGRRLRRVRGAPLPAPAARRGGDSGAAATVEAAEVAPPLLAVAGAAGRAVPRAARRGRRRPRRQGGGEAHQGLLAQEHRHVEGCAEADAGGRRARPHPRSARRHIRGQGSYQLENREPVALKQLAMTPGFHFNDVRWTLRGAAATADGRAGLHVFALDPPLLPGEKLPLGFEHRGRLPDGASKNGGGASEFILESGVVLTSFGPQFVPAIGYLDGIGVDEENESDAKQWTDGWWEGVTPSAFGNDAAATTRITLHVPAEYAANSVGVLESESIADGSLTATWVSDYPVEFFDVICGKWVVARGAGTALYHWPGHAFNVPEMVEALDGSRK